MRKFRFFKSVLLCGILLQSSRDLRDDVPPCPPLQVQLEVTDKNYFNIDRVNLEEKLADDLPFRSYVPTLTYRLRSLATGEVVAERPLASVDTDEQVLSLAFPSDLPFGSYVLTVWGGMEDTSTLTDDHLTLEQHPGHAGGGDIYLANDTLLYDYDHARYTVGMERTKGKLIVEWQQLPAPLHAARYTVDNLYAHLRVPQGYEGVTTVTTPYQWTTPESLISKTMMSPSPGYKESTMHMEFFADAPVGDSYYVPEDVPISISRNELTMMRYIYQPNCCCFTIQVLINDTWETVHGMDIE